MPKNNLALVTCLARDCDEAIDWFREAFNLVLLEDSEHGDGNRWDLLQPA